MPDKDRRHKPRDIKGERRRDKRKTGLRLIAENKRLREYLIAIKNQVPRKTTVHKQSDWARMSCDRVRLMAIEALGKKR